MTNLQKLRDPVECVIKVDNVEILDFYRYLREVRVEMSRSAATVATLVFESARTETGAWLIQDSGKFRPWRKIQIDVWFGSYSEEVMRGYIKEVKADCPPDMSMASVTVTAQDESLLFDREHIRDNLSKEDAQQSDGQIVQKIASDYGLMANVEPGLTHTSLNTDATIIRFLQDRAEANGYELLVRTGTLYFRSMQLNGQPQPKIMMYAGAASNCLRFSASFDGHKPDQVRVLLAPELGTRIDDNTVSPNLPLLGRESADSSNAGLKPFIWILPRPTGATAAEYQARAQARVNESAWKIIANGELDGALYEHVLLSHNTVEVDGVGDTFGGLYYVDEVQHTFNTVGYRQTFKLLRNAIGDQQTTSSNRLASLL
jgi:hypothetical protein